MSKLIALSRISHYFGRSSKACNFITIETVAQLFSCEFCEISKKTFLTEHLRATVPDAKLKLILLKMITSQFSHYPFDSQDNLL